MTSDEEDTMSRKENLPTAQDGSVRPERTVDWGAAAALPSFRSLMTTRLRYIVPALTLSAGFYLAVTLFVGLAPDAASHPVIGAINVGYLLILAVYIVTLTAAVLYVRFSSAVLDPKAQGVINQIGDQEEPCRH